MADSEPNSAANSNVPPAGLASSREPTDSREPTNSRELTDSHEPVQDTLNHWIPHIILLALVAITLWLLTSILAPLKDPIF